jgi:hypothetical protein
MSDQIHKPSIRIEKIQGQMFCIRVSMDVTPGEAPWIPRIRTPSLVMDPSRPTCVGWRWSPPREAGRQVQPATIQPPTQLDTDQRPISFAHSLYKKKTCTLYLADEVDAFFPIGESSYSTAVEIEPTTRTIWFPLPKGRCVYNLQVSFDDLERVKLVRFLDDWFAARDEETPLPFVLQCGSYYNAQAYCQHCFSKTTGTMEVVEIPTELLQDSIRNGSKYPEDGFNPWNQDQKDQIVAHLERELVRLTDFFQRDQSTSAIQSCSTGDQ